MDTLPLVKVVKDRKGRRRWYIKVNQSARWESVKKWWATVALRNKMVRLKSSTDGISSESDL